MAEGDSNADYSSTNVAPLIESFASMLGTDKSSVQFHYPTAPEDVASTVVHPGDKNYLDDYLKSVSESSQTPMEQYEIAAKKSVRLKQYQEDNGIQYFQ